MCCRHHVIEVGEYKKKSERASERGQPNAEYIPREENVNNTHTNADTQHTETHTQPSLLLLIPTIIFISTTNFCAKNK
jgi:hypothetical protein